jgi:hypothetical protein
MNAIPRYKIWTFAKPYFLNIKKNNICHEFASLHITTH